MVGREQSYTQSSGRDSRPSCFVDEIPVRHNRNPMQPTLHWTEDFAICTFGTEGSTTLLLHL